jgi:NitT/TauT family transport system substrate-binding protein
MTIGIMANAGDTLIFIADEQKYFTANGLDVALKTYDNGLVATNAMLKEEVLLAYATEFVVVGKALQKGKINIIATYSKNEACYLVGRKDRRIKNISDLKGKKIGLAPGSINEFYLGRLLDLHGMGIRDITLVDIKLTELGDALGTGKVDAIVAGSRHAHPIIQRQKDRVFIWPVQSGQVAYGTLVGQNDWIARHSELMRRVLASLVQSEDYLIRHPSDVKAAVQKRLKYDDAYMATIWPEHQFSLSLDQSLITAMEDEARWMIKNKLTKEEKVPNFLDYIYEDALKAVKPEAVNIIR